MKQIVASIALALLILCSVQNVSAISFTEKPELKAFIDNMVKEHHFERGYLEQLFAHFHPQKKILCATYVPCESKNWIEYRNYFITPEKVEQGVNYWQKHEAALNYAEQKYGVPASIIVAIVGVESNYGAFQPKYHALNALTTLSFFYPERADFFRGELVDYLLLSRDLHLDPRSVLSSYSGALGLAQFMPISYRQWAVSYKHQGFPDLLHDTDDVVVSVANFLHFFDWHKDEPIAVKAVVLGEKYPAVIFNDIEPKHSLEDIAGYNVKASEKFNNNYKAALLRFATDDSYEDWIVFHNFVVLLHYNTHDNYCMVVYQLAEKIKSLHDRSRLP